MTFDFLLGKLGLPMIYYDWTPHLMAILVTIGLLVFSRQHKVQRISLNPKGFLEFTDARVKKEFLQKGNALIRTWFSCNPDKPADITADSGPMTILPASLANEIRNDKRFDFAKLIFNSFHGHLPGFEGFREVVGGSNIVQSVILRHLTKTSDRVLNPLMDETSKALERGFGGTTEWHAIHLRNTVLELVARVSSRVFLGGELCHNEQWLRITQGYTATVFSVANELRAWPSILRPIVNWLLPSGRQLRAQVNEARELITQEIEKRAKLEKGTIFDDAIEWFLQAAKATGKPCDPTSVQLILSFLAIHTTSDLLSQTLVELAQHPEVVDDLREEIANNTGPDGLTKSSLQGMKLLDSVIKESQRTKPTGIVSMQRLATENVTLSDGTFIPRNHGVTVSALEMWNPKIHQEPQTWDAYRFYRMRDDPARKHEAQLVSTSANHLGFGHGMHACPGRFMAASEIKIIMIEILMNYDLRLPTGAKPQVYAMGFGLSVDPLAEIEVRKRQSGVRV